MLFDLRSGKRRRVVQVVYGFLALIFTVGFVGFGIGGDVSFGLADGCGLRDDGATAGTAGADLEDAQERVEEDPKNPAALRDLATAHVQVANEAGAGGDAEDAIEQYAQAVTAWNAYLATKPQKPDAGAAGTVLPAYAQTLRTLTLEDPDVQITLSGYAETAGIIAEDNPAQATWLNHAALSYLAGDTEAAEQAAQRAISAEEGELDPAEVKKQLAAAEKQGAVLQEQLAKAKKQGGGPSDLLEDPLGGLGGTGGTTPTP